MYIYMQSDCCEFLATPFSCGTETCWPPIASYSLDTRVSSFIQMSGWMRFSAQFFFFLFQKGRRKAFLILTRRRHFPYLCSYPHAPQPAGSQADQTQKALQGGKEICYSYLESHPQLLCTHYHSPSSYKKCGVSNMGWIWPILLISTELPTVFYRTSNIAEALKGKQTGGLLLKNMLKFYRHIISDNVHRKYKKKVHGEAASKHSSNFHL